jgi:hypothetical protein
LPSSDKFWIILIRFGVLVLSKIIKVFKNTLNTKINHSAILFADKKRQ